MKNSSKIFLISFLIIFLVSNTGLPVSIHLCRMMNQASLEECDMCESHKNACCNDNDALKIVKSKNNNCCDTRIAAEPLKDRYVSLKEITCQINNVAIELPEFVESENLLSEFRNSTYSSHSPPGSLDQEIFLLNSTLLI